MDHLSPEARSRLMASIKGRDTHPERVVRSAAHGLGYRFRLCRRDLPGRPDVVFPRLGKVVLVHGCFWHRHGRCRAGRTRPKTRAEFWAAKFEANRRRDRRNVRALRRLGWEVLVVWECETRDAAGLRERLEGFLGGPAGGRARR